MRVGNAADAKDQRVQGAWRFLHVFSGHKISSSPVILNLSLASRALLPLTSKSKQVNKAEASQKPLYGGHLSGKVSS